MFGKNIKTHNDEKLMQQIAIGDQYAFSILYNRYKSRLYYYFFRMLNNSEEMANDFLQELFIKVIENAENFDVSQKFSSWVFSMAGNMCKNEYRKRRTRREIINNELSNIYETEEIKFATYSTEQLIDKVFETLSLLDYEHRSTFLLRYREGFSLNEIAEIQNIAKGTVKSRLHNAKKQLSKRLYYLKDEIEF